MEQTISISSPADIKKSTIIFQSSRQQSSRYPFYPPNENIPGISEVLYIPKDGEKYKNGELMPKDGFVRTARYQPGMSGIWADEWTDKERESKITKIYLQIGYKSVSVRDKNLLDYLRVCGYNEINTDTRLPDTGVIFKEVDYEIDSKKVIKAEIEADKAKHFVNTAPISEVKAIAVALAKSQGEITAIYAMEEYELRYSLRGAVKTNPEAFLGTMKDGAIKNKVYVVKALIKGIIKEDEEMGYLSWSYNDEVFVEAPSGMSVVDHFCELSTNNPDYIKILSHIKNLVKEESNTKNTTQIDSEKDNEEAPQLEWNELLIEEALKDGRILLKGNWYQIPGKNKGDDPLFKIQGPKNLSDAVKENKDGILSLLTK